MALRRLWQLSQDPALALGVVAILAFAIRAGVVIAQSTLSIFEIYFVAADSVLYLELARNLSQGLGLSVNGVPTAYVGPMYPLFLVPLLAIGLGPLGIGIFQSVLGAGTVVAAGLATRELALAQRPARADAWRLAFISAIGVAVYPHLIFWTGYVLTETLFVFLIATALYLVLRAVRSPTLWWSSAAGLTFGLATLTRAPALAAAILIAAWWAATSRRPGGLVAPLVFAAALAIPLFLWAGRNGVEMGFPVVTSTESGYVFYQGNSRGATGGTRGYVDGYDFTDADVPSGLGEVERDAFYLRRALSDIAADPLETVRRWPTKVWNMWRPTYDDASLRNSAITLATYLPTLVLGLAGTFALARNGFHLSTALPLVFLAAWFAVHVLVTGMIRFRLPAELVLIMVAPFGVTSLLGRRRESPRGD